MSICQVDVTDPNFFEKGIELLLLLYGDVVVAPQKRLVFAEFVNILSNKYVCQKHVLFNEVLGLDLGSLLEGVREPAFPVQRKVEFSVHEHHRTVFEPVSAPFLRKLIHLEAICNHILKLLA